MLFATLGITASALIAQEVPSATVATESFSDVERLESLLEINETERVIDETSALIASIESNRGYYSEELFSPLVILGDAEYQRGNYNAALDSWSRARQVNRQIYGLHNLEQADVLYKEADALFAQEEYADANAKHEHAFSMYLRKYGNEAVEILPGLNKLATWYLDTYNVYAARGLYEDVLTIARKNLPETDPEIISGLKNLARTYRMERFRPDFLPPVTLAFKALPYGASVSTAKYYPDVNNYAPGEQALKDVIKLQLQADDVTIEEFTASKLDLADWYLLFEKYQRATVVYTDVWNSLYGTTAEDYLRTQMGEPKRLYLPLPNDPMPRTFTPETTVMRGEIEVSFKVIPEGKTRKVKILRSDPGDILDIAVVTAVRNGRFRPAFQEGEAVATEDLVLVHKFNYTEEALAEAQ